jgi:hypothetical protein
MNENNQEAEQASFAVEPKPQESGDKPAVDKGPQQPENQPKTNERLSEVKKDIKPFR